MHLLSFKKPYIQYILPIMLSAIALSWLYRPELEILRDDSTFIMPYTDQNRGGNSVASVSKDPNGNITYTYTLGDGRTFPYAGIMIIKKDSSFFDLSGYNCLSINAIDNINKGIIPVYLFTHIDKYSQWNNVGSFLNNMALIPAEDIGKASDLPFDMFTVPKWWYEIQSTDIQSNTKPDYSKVGLLNFANLGTSKNNIEYSVTISKITAKKNMFVYYTFTAVLLLFYYSILFAAKWLMDTTPENNIINKQVTFTYEKVAAVEEPDRTDGVFEFINNNYFTSELSIADVQKETGISERKIAQIIKEKTDLSFKQYVNNIRLSEAKRMLKDTDLQISEIAYRIGYNNVTHFNRVFKLAENISPSNFRLQFSEKN